MRQLTIFIFMIILGSLMSACGVMLAEQIRGSGHIISEPRNVSNFNELHVSGSGTLIIEQKDSEALTIEGEDNIVAEIKSEVVNHQLFIGTRRENVNLNPTQPLIYRLSVKQLDSMGVSGSAAIQAATLSAKDLTANVNGSGNIAINRLTADTLKALLSGSGSINVGGTVSQQDVQVSGSGSYQAEKLESKNTTARATGSGSLAVRVSDALDAHVSGSAIIHYIGEPRVTKAISGSGAVVKRSE